MRLFDREPKQPLSSGLRRSMLSLGEDFTLDSSGAGVNWPDLSGVGTLVASEPSASRLVSDRPEMGEAMEGFRLLGHRLRTIKKTGGAKRVLVTSSIPGEGKTVVAANLAIVLARASASVLLVESDMRKLGSAGAFGRHESLPGLADWLEERELLSEVLHRVEDYNLWTIPAGAPARNPGELIQKPEMRQLLESAGQKFDWVIVDSPPLNPFIDAQLLAGITDTTVLVLRSGVTLRSAYENSLKQLKGAALAGVVLNGYDEPARKDYYSYYGAGR